MVDFVNWSKIRISTMQVFILQQKSGLLFQLTACKSSVWVTCTARGLSEEGSTGHWEPASGFLQQSCADLSVISSGSYQVWRREKLITAEHLAHYVSTELCIIFITWFFFPLKKPLLAITILILQVSKLRSKMIK